VAAKQSSVVQSGSSATWSSAPETIDDSDEAERVSQMLQRDNLVRGLGVVDLVHRLLKSVHDNDPTTALFSSDVDRPPPSHVSEICVCIRPGGGGAWDFNFNAFC